MDSSTKQLAADILALEEVHQSGGLSETQLKSWRELVCQLLLKVCPRNERRKDLRVPADLQVTLRKGDQQCSAKVVDLHRTAMALTGDLAALSDGDAVEIQSFQVGDATHYTTIPATVTTRRRDELSGQDVVALKLGGDSAEAQERFFKIAFYPAYMQYLRGLAD